jgi:signal transduction histidine kinase
MVGLRTIEDLSSDPQVKLQASELRRIGGETHDSIRRLARGLRPAILDDLGLVPALERYLEDLATAYHLKIEFLPECDHQSRLPLEKETSVFRIVQEATTNAIRHGHPQNLQIRLECDTTEFRLTIADDGCGFNVAEALKVTDEKSPFGLLSIYERSLLLGGAAVITSLPNMGTQVKVRFPLETTENGNG